MSTPAFGTPAFVVGPICLHMFVVISYLCMLSPLFSKTKKKLSEFWLSYQYHIYFPDFSALIFLIITEEVAGQSVSKISHGTSYINIFFSDFLSHFSSHLSSPSFLWRHMADFWELCPATQKKVGNRLNYSLLIYNP